MIGDQAKIGAIQAILSVTVDGIWGNESQGALDALIASSQETGGGGVEHVTYASSFADPADVAAFDECKEQGNSDDYCFQFGDNGIGCWGDSTKEGSGPSCALPPEYMEQKWGSVAAAKNKEVFVTRHSKEEGRYEVVCILKDRMPHLENLANQARIDLNPDACKELGLTPPVMTQVTWKWMA